MCVCSGEKLVKTIMRCKIQAKRGGRASLPPQRHAARHTPFSVVPVSHPSPPSARPLSPVREGPLIVRR